MGVNILRRRSSARPTASKRSFKGSLGDKSWRRSGPSGIVGKAWHILLALAGLPPSPACRSRLQSVRRSLGSRCGQPSPQCTARHVKSVGTADRASSEHRRSRAADDSPRPSDPGAPMQKCLVRSLRRVGRPAGVSAGPRSMPEDPRGSRHAMMLGLVLLAGSCRSVTAGPLKKVHARKRSPRAGRR